MKRQFPVYISDETRAEFEKVAEAGHMEASRYAATWISELSTLKPEFALKALGMIPAEWKHRRPGRPSSTAGAERKDGAMPVQDVA